jgi:hypothetical protein
MDARNLCIFSSDGVLGNHGKRKKVGVREMCANGVQNEPKPGYSVTPKCSAPRRWCESTTKTKKTGRSPLTR